MTSDTISRLGGKRIGSLHRDVGTHLPRTALHGTRSLGAWPIPSYDSVLGATELASFTRYTIGDKDGCAQSSKKSGATIFPSRSGARGRTFGSSPSRSRTRLGETIAGHEYRPRASLTSKKQMLDALLPVDAQRRRQHAALLVGYWPYSSLAIQPREKLPCRNRRTGRRLPSHSRSNCLAAA